MTAEHDADLRNAIVDLIDDGGLAGTDETTADAIMELLASRASTQADRLLDAKADARHLWAELAKLRYEVHAAVNWFQAGEEEALAVVRLFEAQASAGITLGELAGLYGIPPPEAGPT